MSASGPLFSPVGLSNSLEPKFGWLAFPGLIRGITILHIVMFVLLILRGEHAFQTIALFAFDWEQILAGEVWRLGSFLLLPPVFAGGTFGVLFMFIAVMIAFMINDALEGSWGVFRTSLYCYGIMVCQILAHTLLSVMGVPVDGSQGGLIFYESVFLAFASTFPRHEFRLFFIIPVQVWVLGAVLGVIIVLQSFSSIYIAMYLYLCFLPYIVWGLPRLVRWSRQRGQTAVRRAKFNQHAAPGAPAFHTCEICGATDGSHPDREFRVTEDDRELCDACLQRDAVDRGSVESEKSN